MVLDLSIAGNLRQAIAALSPKDSSPSDIFFWLTRAKECVNTGICNWSDLGTSEEGLILLLEEADKLQIIKEVRQLVSKSDPNPEQLWVIYDAIVDHNISWQDLKISQEEFEDILAQAEDLLED